MFFVVFVFFPASFWLFFCYFFLELDPSFVKNTNRPINISKKCKTDVILNCSHCLLTCLTAIFIRVIQVFFQKKKKKINALLGSNGGIWFPISLCGDPNWRATFSTTHRRDERRQWADQRGCRGPIKLLEFHTCHRTIPASESPAAIKPRCRTRHIWMKRSQS